MSAPVQSEPSPTTSAEMAAAGPAGLGPGQRAVIAGRYRLLEFIAEGGMGAVYRAEHVLSRKKLALKVVHPYLCKGRQGVERFRREVSAAAEIDHPGIVQVYDAGVDDDGGFFMAMELLEGESLGDLLRRDWPGMARAVRLVEGMLEPLAKAHAKGFVHRDLKPDNVFLALDEEGREKVKILDFGLAREVAKGGPTRTGITFGTPEYMSPEQALSARKVRAPGDVWSVGVMLYELLSGEHPFGGETPNAIMANAIKEDLPPLRERAPHVPELLAALIERSLEKKAEARPADAGAMLEALRAVLACVTLDDTVPAAPAPPPVWNASEDEAEGSDPFPLGPLPSSRSASLEIHVGDETLAPSDLAPSLAGTSRGTMRVALLAGGGLALVLAAGALAWAAFGPDSAPGPMAAPEPRMEMPELAVLEEPAPPHEPPAPVALAPEPIIEPDAPEPAAPEPEPEAPATFAADTESAERPLARGSGRAPRAERRQATSDEPGPSALEEARECSNRGDRQCARRILESRARTAPEHALLIDTYRSLGLMPQALDAMQRFVTRFPRASETPGYREDLRRYRP